MQYIELTMDYVWALEVLVCHYLDAKPDQDPDDVAEARQIVNGEGLDRPMDRR